jgi:hypothetical protein
MAGKDPPSTTHMRCSRSSGNSLITPSSFRLVVRCIWMLKRHVSVWLGWRCRGQVPCPLAGARSAGLEAGTATQAQSLVSFGSDRSCLPGSTPPDRPRSTSSPVFHAASCHINSYPVAARSGCTLNPHARDNGLGKRNPSLATACFSPSWMRSVPWTSAGLIRPDRTSLSLSSHGAVPFRYPAPIPAHAAFSTAPSGTSPCFT